MCDSHRIAEDSDMQSESRLNMVQLSLYALTKPIDMQVDIYIGYAMFVNKMMFVKWAK
jgi:hypothetical protein